MDFYALLDQVVDLLRSRQRVTYRMLKRQFDLDDTALEDLKEELLFAHPQIADEEGRGLVWTPAPAPSTLAVETRQAPPLDSSIPPHLAEKILTSRSELEGERKHVTVLFADLKGSLELLADRDPEEARQLLDPVLERMMAAVHRYEGTVNQVMGDGIMALFGAPIAHEDHAVRACYAALAMQEAIRRYSAEVRRGYGLEVQIWPRRSSGALSMPGSRLFGTSPGVTPRSSCGRRDHWTDLGSREGRCEETQCRSNQQSIPCSVRRTSTVKPL
jgi:Adenylate and Guanylate cyclase catalytic domain